MEFESKQAEVDYFAGVSQAIQDDLKLEMLNEQRNLLFQIRSMGSQYKLVDQGFREMPEYEHRPNSSVLQERRQK
jgi:hypothetical protein